LEHAPGWRCFIRGSYLGKTTPETIAATATATLLVADWTVELAEVR
jgi:hypothetical protein